MPDAPISIFISYSRSNSSFVDRLEADLKARNFHTWVDRRKLEGGQVWMNVLQDAIEQCDVLLVVLSPEAVESQYVQMEYRHAQHLGKLVIPLEYKPCPRVPMDLNGIQWVNIKEERYEQGLQDLLIALSRVKPSAAEKPKQPSGQLALQTKQPALVLPQPAPPPPELNLNDLYKEGLTAKVNGDLERTVILWQQILDRDPNFLHGTFAPQMKWVVETLRTPRIQNLRRQAEEAANAGAWGQETGAWKALLGLEPQDTQAQRRLPVAEHNQKYAQYYENAIQFVEEQSLLAAKEQLEILWHDAPYYGDPAGLAKKVGIESKIRTPASIDEDLHALPILPDEEDDALPIPPPQPKYNAIRRNPIVQPTASTNISPPHRIQRPKTPRPSVPVPQPEPPVATPRRPAPKTPRPSVPVSLSNKDKRRKFIEDKLKTNPFVVWLCAFCLLSGLGTTIGMLVPFWLVQPWYWVAGTIAITVILLYFLGYRKGVNFFVMLLIALGSFILAFGLTRYISPTVLDYNHAQTSQIWFVGTRTLWLGRQVDFGLILGTISPIACGVWDASYDLDQVILIGLIILGALVGLLGWLVLSLIALLPFGWGFGFGAGWNLALIAGIVGIVGGSGLVASFRICKAAFG